MRRALVAALAVAVVAALAPFASGAPDGLERVAGDHGFAGHARPAAAAPAADYVVPGIRDARLANALAGFAGTLAVFALGAGVVAVVRHRQRPA